MFVTLGVSVALAASTFQLWPSGDQHGQLVTKYQPITLAAMEGRALSQRDRRADRARWSARHQPAETGQSHLCSQGAELSHTSALES
jgi:cytochrome bd-type quinol oxidase subunit 1